MNMKDKKTNQILPLDEFGTKNIIKKASLLANELQKIIEKQKIYVVIEGKKFITVEGWNTLGAMLGVFPEVTSTEKKVEEVNLFLVKRTKKNGDVEKIITENPLPTDEVIDKIVKRKITYEAEVRLKTISGVEISRARAICSSSERGKEDKPEFILMSMAQTRATGKAFRLAFSWIVKMAGFEPTPAEEAEEFNDEEKNNQQKLTLLK